MNAMAHAVEALYAQDGNPIVVADGGGGAAGVRRKPAERSSQTRRPRGAQRRRSTAPGCAACASPRPPWRCTTSSAMCSAAPSTCRTRRRTRSCCRTPSPTTQAAAPEAHAQRSRGRLDARMPPDGLYDLLRSLDVPLALKDIGMPEDGIERAVRARVERSLLEPAAARSGCASASLIRRAFAGEPPRSD